ncbi:MAG: GFA family protein [Gammaproteobacteria bacterium]|nr:GFA family protein [Gammaproteobacteria bacterium]MCY4278153.1 GFA family protein [Gammaproteobacteria bacterium]
MGTELRTFQGACHCGSVRFEVDAPTRVTLLECNCSVCRIVGFLHLIVPLDRFRLLAGAEMLTTYTFNTGTAQHTFCKRCGVKPFYVPRSHPNGKSVNARCLDRSEFEEVSIEPFDGANWERNVAEIQGRLAT